MIQGTLIDPFTLADALQSSRIKPGHTIYLRNGIYTGAFVSTLVGVTIQPYENEKPIIDGSLTVYGSDCTFKNIEVLNSAWVTRWSNQVGSAPTDIPIAGIGGSAIDIFGPRTTVQNCIMHDTRQGLGLWASAPGSTVENCLFYNNGWFASDRAHGPCLYTQNRFLPMQTIKNNVFANTFSTVGLHAYTEGGYMWNYRFSGNVIVNQVNVFTGYTNGIDGIVCEDNIFYGGSFFLSNGNVINGACDVQNTLLLNNAVMNHYGTFTNYSELGTTTQFGDRILERGRNVIVLNESNVLHVVAPKRGTYINCQNPSETLRLNQGDVLPMHSWTVANPYAMDTPLLDWNSKFGVFIVTP